MSHTRTLRTRAFGTTASLVIATAVVAGAAAADGTGNTQSVPPSCQSAMSADACERSLHDSTASRSRVIRLKDVRGDSTDLDLGTPGSSPGDTSSSTTR